MQEAPFAGGRWLRGVPVFGHADELGLTDWELSIS
jgi:hypothetical protein